MSGRKYNEQETIQTLQGLKYLLEAEIARLRADKDALLALLKPCPNWIDFAYHNLNSVTDDAVVQWLPKARAAIKAAEGK